MRIFKPKPVKFSTFAMLGLSALAAFSPAFGVGGAKKAESAPSAKPVPQISAETRAEIKKLSRESVEILRGGKPKEALQPALAALSKSEQAFGKDHFEVSKVLTPLAQIYGELGQHEKASKVHLRLIPILSRVYGARTTQVARVREQLSDTYLKLGQRALAQKELESSLDIKRQVFGPNNVNLAMTLNKVADFYVANKSTKKAIPLWEQSTGIFRRVFNERNPNLRITSKKLEAAYRATGQDAKADALIADQ
ncbi:MAG: tetratricopeptide repeat protein [Hyphomicrobiaceae bacterium]